MKRWVEFPLTTQISIALAIGLLLLDLSKHGYRQFWGIPTLKTAIASGVISTQKAIGSITTPSSTPLMVEQIDFVPSRVSLSTSGKVVPVNYSSQQQQLKLGPIRSSQPKPNQRNSNPLADWMGR